MNVNYECNFKMPQDYKSCGAGDERHRYTDKRDDDWMNSAANKILPEMVKIINTYLKSFK